jgi:hypothetical protein
MSIAHPAVSKSAVRTLSRPVLGALFACAGLLAGAARAADPDFGPDVLVFSTATPSAQIQSALNAIAGEAEFSANRHAVLFKPGTYAVDAQVGYYTTVAGLGLQPDDVIINGGLRAEGPVDTSNYTDSALVNFWRSIENLSVTPTGGSTRWAVSQASPMRRVHVRGGLNLMPAYWGYSSGGYIADSKIDGQVQSGSQQQWYSRDSMFGSWAGSVWNQVFSGVQGAPAQSFPSPPFTTLASTPKSREKPFLYVDASGNFQVFRPALRTNAQGTTWAFGAVSGTSIPIGSFFIVKPSHSAAQINSALFDGKHLLFTPGIYKLTEQLNVTHPDTVIMGIGMPTLVPQTGQPAIAESDEDGVSISGLIIDAGPVNSTYLVQIGGRGSFRDHTANPSSLHDVFFRIGGASAGTASISLEVNSYNVILDHIWAWRADHGAGAGWTQNVAPNGVVVNGNNVIATGLFVEHYQKNQVLWNGNGGTTIFYQSELPYDVPSQASWMNGGVKGYASYAVGANVTTHQAWGLGVYSYFNQGQPIVEASAITAPNASGVQIRDAVSVFLAGSGSISHVVNKLGATANASSPTSFLTSN